MSTASEKARKIAELHRNWVKGAEYTSVPVAGPSQYPETEEDVHTAPASDNEFMTAMKQILAEPDTSRSSLRDAPVFEVVGQVKPKGEAS